MAYVVLETIIDDLFGRTRPLLLIWKTVAFIARDGVHPWRFENKGQKECDCEVWRHGFHWPLSIRTVVTWCVRSAASPVFYM